MGKLILSAIAKQRPCDKVIEILSDRFCILSTAFTRGKSDTVEYDDDYRIFYLTPYGLLIGLTHMSCVRRAITVTLHGSVASYYDKQIYTELNNLLKVFKNEKDTANS